MARDHPGLTAISRAEHGPAAEYPGDSDQGGPSLPTGLSAHWPGWRPLWSGRRQCLVTCPLPDPIVTQQPITYTVPGGPGSQGLVPQNESRADISPDLSTWADEYLPNRQVALPSHSARRNVISLGPPQDWPDSRRRSVPRRNKESHKNMTLTTYYFRSEDI